jgi:peptide-methionine (S)-S-oxide reductase
VTFDPSQVSYGTLLQIYFSVAQPHRTQSPGTGQRHSVSFGTFSQKRRTAKGRAGLHCPTRRHAKSFGKPIVTKLESYNGFYPAEEEHQDFLTEHPTYPYIVINDLPKVAQLKQLYPDRYQEKPVLVKAGM